MKPRPMASHLAVVHPDGGLPDGQLYHAAGPADGGILIAAVWDSKESADRFVSEVLIPSMPAEGGFSGEPEERVAEVTNLQTPEHRGGSFSKWARLGSNYPCPRNRVRTRRGSTSGRRPARYRPHPCHQSVHLGHRAGQSRREQALRRIAMATTIDARLFIDGGAPLRELAIPKP